jgi:hypothetical protein
LQSEIFKFDNNDIVNEVNSNIKYNNEEPVNDFINYLKQNGKIYDDQSRSHKLHNEVQTICYPNARRNLIDTIHEVSY